MSIPQISNSLGKSINCYKIQHKGHKYTGDFSDGLDKKPLQLIKSLTNNKQFGYDQRNCAVHPK